MYYIGNIPCDPNYLEHSGVKGMRWGVRRYQNEDGTLTEAGKLRYSSGLTDKERSRYDKYDNSTRGIERSFNKMDKDYAIHYGKLKEHAHRYNKKMEKAMTIARKKYGDDIDIDTAKAKDKRVEKLYLQATDSMWRGHNENKKMSEIEASQWKKIGEAVELGYDVKADNVTRNTTKMRAGMSVVGAIIGGVAGNLAGRAIGKGFSNIKAPRGSARRQFFANIAPTAGTVAGVSNGFVAYDAYKKSKGNPLSITGNKLSVTKSSNETGSFKPSPKMMIEYIRRGNLDEEERKKSNSK